MKTVDNLMTLREKESSKYKKIYPVDFKRASIYNEQLQIATHVDVQQIQHNLLIKLYSLQKAI